MSDTSIIVLVQETLWVFMLLSAPVLGVFNYCWIDNLNTSGYYKYSGADFNICS